MNIFKSKKLARVLIYFCAATLIATSVIVPFTLSAFVKDSDSDGPYGEIALRSYFECGTGEDEENAFVITKPNHLYNLSRLQALGAFSTKKYFKLGLKGLDEDNPDDIMCYKSDDPNDGYAPYLNMASSDYSHQPINAIGSEATPFYGDFDGQDLEIRNLTVYADPEDAGLFGYTAHNSNVHNLYLNDIKIAALGYTNGFVSTYGPSATISNGANLTYKVGNVSPYTFVSGSDTTVYKELNFDAADIFDWNGSGNPPAITATAPLIAFTRGPSTFDYKLLISGDFLKDNLNDTASVDLLALYKFFRKERNKNNATYPIKASTSVSLVGFSTNSDGLVCSKVISTLSFEFSLNASDISVINMKVHLTGKHGNNIGLVVGHCDGSIDSCYVYKGQFVMNNGNALTSTSIYNNMENGSNFGLIGLIGGTVHNLAAEQSDASTKKGKEVGLLDFTSIYDEIIDADSFKTSNPANSRDLAHGVTYVPAETSGKYKPYLRYNNSNEYVTKDRNSVTFNGMRCINTSDFGIFVLATNQSGTGLGGDAENDLDLSVISKVDQTVSGNCFVYYATGEYDASKGIDFEKYRESIASDNPTEFYPAYHFPHADQITSESFEQRDRHQNYIIRFKLEGSDRNGFYMSDVDKTKPGGSFMSKYFENKLVDENGDPILASADSQRSGVMIRDSQMNEVTELNTSLITPDLSYDPDTEVVDRPKMFCLDNSNFGDPAANMINFSIETTTSNVTVVAGLVDNSKPAAVGIYKLADINPSTGVVTPVTRQIYEGHKYVNISYDDPDYAFFMPTDNQLAYFDYGKDEYGTYQIGVYNEAHTAIVPATTNTSAIVPKENGYSEYGYSSGKTRLYCHTFKLEPGQYCIGSATGPSRGTGEGIAKIYNVCAQGQTNGKYSFAENAFASQDEVKDTVDFLMKPRFTVANNGKYTETVTPSEKDVQGEYIHITEFDPSDSNVENQRCYVALANSSRSEFKKNSLCIIRFYYDGTQFVITAVDEVDSRISYLSQVTSMTVSNYRANYGTLYHIDDMDDNILVKLFEYNAENEDTLNYPKKVVTH